MNDDNSSQRSRRLYELITNQVTLQAGDVLDEYLCVFKESLPQAEQAFFLKLAKLQGMSHQQRFSFLKLYADFVRSNEAKWRTSTVKDSNIVENFIDYCLRIDYQAMSVGQLSELVGFYFELVESSAEKFSKYLGHMLKLFVGDQLVNITDYQSILQNLPSSELIQEILSLIEAVAEDDINKAFPDALFVPDDSIPIVENYVRLVTPDGSMRERLKHVSNVDFNSSESLAAYARHMNESRESSNDIMQKKKEAFLKHPGISTQKKVEALFALREMGSHYIDPFWGSYAFSPVLNYSVPVFFSELLALKNYDAINERFHKTFVEFFNRVDQAQVDVKQCTTGST